MPPLIDTIVQWLHLIAAFTWIGGLIFVNVVLTPAVGPRGIPPQFVRLMGMERFRWYVWGSIIVLALTGSYNILKHLGAETEFVVSAGTIALVIKLFLVGVMIAITAVNSLVLRRKLVKGTPPGGPTPKMEKMGRVLVFLSRANLVLGLGVLLMVAII